MTKYRTSLNQTVGYRLDCDVSRKMKVTNGMVWYGEAGINRSASVCLRDVPKQVEQQRKGERNKLLRTSFKEVKAKAYRVL